ncbi:tagaturonate epimerase family protein [Aerococcaceae bacterium zg-BR22]|uniref:tagaturonate epimerase family protein n=1 Tax=Aerococcaceae bacterium zg-1292 TaxID=2774330 RepID=UPI004063DFAC|nr:tagaturonate epimerase family protein [Aerococcaceae bacterium zg-BR22]
MEIIKYFEQSRNKVEEVEIVTVLTKEGTFLEVTGEGAVYDEFEGEDIEPGRKIAPTNHANRLVLNRYFDYTNPRAFGTSISTLGLGDRLGLAGFGQLQAVSDLKIRPILAQQSIRELDLTERKFEDVLDAAAFAVYQAGYTKGFGADGDHLKLEKDIEYAIGVGMSMLTLDCSDYIDNEVPEYSLEMLEEKYVELVDEATRQHYEETYLNRTFDVEGQVIEFSREALLYNAVQYHRAIEYMIHVYNTYVKTVDRAIDFEISIDETMTVTSPESHFFVANELHHHDVVVTSLAPRFVGEFQKGIDYIGEVEAFETDFDAHARIARHFGYKVSVHSGSDKFSVFPVVAKCTNGLFHVKTAGTNWLEAVRLVAQKDPKFFREMYAFADEHFPEAQKYYHITPDLSKIKPIDTVSDAELPEYLNDDNARQLLHVTYGLLLTEKDVEGNYVFKNRFYQLMHEYLEDYAALLADHIGKHLSKLDVPEE